MEAMSNETVVIEFMWARCGTTGHFSGLDLILCEPELANEELTNADQLKGKLAIAKRGGGSFVDKAQRVVAAGAHGLVVVNTDNSLIEVATVNDYVAEIPVATIKAKDGEVLLSGCDPACLMWIPAKRQFLKRILAMQDAGKWKEIVQLELHACIVARAFQLSEVRSIRRDAGVIFNCLGNSYISPS